MFCAFMYLGLLAIFVGSTGSTAISSMIANNRCFPPCRVFFCNPNRPVSACQTPNNMSLGLTIDQVSGEQDTGVTQPSTDHCSCCPESRRNFYTSATTSIPSDAIGNAEVALDVYCPSTQLCLCDSAGICCTPASGKFFKLTSETEVADVTAPDSIYLIPYCDDLGCVMNTIMKGQEGVPELHCDDGMTYTYADQQDSSTGEEKPLNSDSYFNADRVSCRGCENIRMNGCVGPTLAGPG
ncbi:hypothetical protein M3Y98_00672400 [Aphelenchoides besseyi]|nr:hypothetical protein M3Y98_00672400 [Aphelenchoides besseyi]